MDYKTTEQEKNCSGRKNVARNKRVAGYGKSCSKSCATSDRPKPNQCTVQSRSQGLSFENKIERVLKEEPSTT